MLGDDLFKRRVQGKVVTIKCRHCDAEISVDGSSPYNEAPARPAPPRRALEKETAGAIAAETAGAVALSPGLLSVREEPPKAPAALADTPKAPPLRPRPPEARRVKPASPPASPPLRGKDTLVDLGFPEEDEPPPSSGTPTLSALTAETAPKPTKSPGKQGKSQDFLMNLRSADDGLLAAPTIDVSGLSAQAPPPVEPKHALTQPLFDMAAVFDASASNAGASQQSSLAPAQIDVPIEVDTATQDEPRVRKLVLAPPTLETAQVASDEPPRKSRGGGIVLGILLAAALGAVAVVKLRPRTAELPSPDPVAEKKDEPAALPAPLVERVAPSSPAPSAPAEPAAPPDSTAASQATANPARREQPAGVAASPSSSAATRAENAKPASADTPPAEPSEPPKTQAEPTQAIEKPTAEEPAAEFDRAAALSSLKAAAVEASACRKEGDPSGTASVTITFAPSGRVTSATLSGPPFAGTATGGCIASAMRRAKVPPFAGDRVTVGKTIVIQ
jgi:hypothetical protein